MIRVLIAQPKINSKISCFVLQMICTYYATLIWSETSYTIPMEMTIVTIVVCFETGIKKDLTFSILFSSYLFWYTHNSPVSVFKYFHSSCLSWLAFQLDFFFCWYILLFVLYCYCMDAMTCVRMRNTFSIDIFFFILLNFTSFVYSK